MRAREIVVIEPSRELGVALLGVVPVPGVDPFAQRGLDETLGLAVGAWGVGTGAGVANVKLLTGESETVGTIAAAVIGKQGTNGDVVAGVEGEGVAQEAEGGLGLLIGQQLGSSTATCKALRPGWRRTPRRRPSPRRLTC